MEPHGAPDDQIDFSEIVKTIQRRDQFLNKLLSLSDRENFLAAARANKCTNFFHSKTQYQITSAADLNADDEGRLYNNDAVFEARIFTLPELALRNSRSVKFVNCIFVGDLHIGGDDLRTVLLDNCMCLGICNIVGSDGDYLEIHIWNSNFRALRIGSNRIKTLDIGSSRAYEFDIFNNKCTQFSANTNVFKRFRFTQNEIEKCDFSHRQVDITLTLGAGANGYKFGGESASKQPLEELSTLLLDFSTIHHDTSLVQLETLSFLKERSTVRFDQTGLSRLRYYSAFLSQSRMAAVFVKITQAFENPILFVGYGGIVLVGFAALFTLPFCGFTHGADLLVDHGANQLRNVVTWGLRWPEALYMSGVTFATIGYGDITPIGMTSYLAVTEGLLGVLLMSAFVVALVKRYVER